MAGETAAVPTRGVNATNLAEAFRLTSEDRADDVAVRTLDGSTEWTWNDLREKTDALAGALHGLGLRRGDTIALMISNRPEFHLADLAAMMVGATPFSIYMTYAPGQIAYVVGDADAKIIITEEQFADNVIKAREELPHLEHVIVIDGEGRDGVMTLDEALQHNDGSFDVDASVAEIGPEDVLTLIYTSGTTGPPKGVELVHRNLITAVHQVEELIQLPPDGRVISWLPNAHIAERNAHHYLPIVFGWQVTTLSDPRKVLEALPQVRPSWFFAVPRIWEKLKAGLDTMRAGVPDEQRIPMEEALNDAIEKVRLEQRGEEVPADLAERVAANDEKYFAGLRAMLGLDQVIAINVGAAPTPIEVLEFFHAIALPLGELWGMSETCGAGTCNPPDRIKIGTVGPPTPGCELTLADDGELLIRGGLVMLGYRGLPDKTAEAIDADGWLHTGDIAQIDDDGYVKIVDRKKEIIINAAGKNMSPANIEATVKSASPLIGNAVCIGDAKPYNTALIVLDADFAPAWAAQNGIEGATLESLSHDERLRAAVQEGIDG